MRDNDFGAMPDGRRVRRLLLGGAPGVELHLLDLGATVHRLVTTCGDGVRRDVVLGHPTPEEHLASSDYIGASVGRYANRIAGGELEVDGRALTVGTNDRGNSLHGGPDGFDRRVWDVVETSETLAVLELVSPDGDQGFPGTLRARARYQVDDDAVRITYEARTDAPTVVNLTSHAYLNLDGDGSGTVDDHELVVEADGYLPVDPTGIPLGGIEDVAGTPFDLRSPRQLGPLVRDGHEQVVRARGLDHSWALRGEGQRDVAVLTSHRSGTVLTLATDQPALQVYTGNMLDGTRVSKGGGRYRQGDGIALEPQLFPDTPNRPELGQALLLPGETYRSSTTWRFSTLR